MIIHASCRKLESELKLYGISVLQSIEFLKMIAQKYQVVCDPQIYESLRKCFLSMMSGIPPEKHTAIQILSSVPLEPESFKKRS